MLPFEIKVCGVTRVEDALCACEAGADAIGLNFFRPSARFLETDQAVRIADAIREFNRERTSPVRMVGVFVNLPAPAINDVISRVGLDGIQLHGDEEPTLLVDLHRADRFLVRAIRTRPTIDQDEIPDPVELEKVRVDITKWKPHRTTILLDARVTGEFGGTGQKISWNLVPRIAKLVEMDLVLAGGLDPWNVGDAVKQTGALAVDVASGVESIPGAKDHDLVHKFVVSARKAIDENRSDRTK